MGKRGKRGKQKNKTKERNLARERDRSADKRIERLTRAIRKSRACNLALYPWLQSQSSAASAADTVPPQSEEKAVTPAGVTRVSIESDSDSESDHALSDSSEALETCREEFPANQAEEPSQID